MDSPLYQKTILVTGASSGIGRATCRELASQGANVILLARNENGMRETMSAMPCEQCLPLVTDLRDIPALPAILQQAWDWRGQIDGFIHCAGLGGRERLRDTTVVSMTERMQIHCFAFVELVRQIIKRKKRNAPLRIVAISSLAALGYDKYMIAYAASKAALEAAARSMAVELASKNTTVNLIRPAFVNTPMIAAVALVCDELNENLKNYQPLGIIEPEEVARLTLYLLSPAAAHISGSIFSINAGAPC